RAFREVEMLRHHADDLAHDGVDGDRFIEDVGIAAETSLPEAVSDNGHGVFAGLIFFVDKGAAHDGLHREGIEEVCSNEEALDAFGWFHAGEVWTPPAIKRKLLKRVILSFQVEIVRERHFVVQHAVTRHLVPHGDDAIEFGEWQGFEKERIDGAEDGSVSADAEGECDDGDDGEAGPSQEISYCVPDVAEETLHDRLLSPQKAQTGLATKRHTRLKRRIHLRSEE